MLNKATVQDGEKSIQNSIFIATNAPYFFDV
jgi:hypothetical protein